jgi:lysophospholipase L1-like esterase
MPFWRHIKFLQLLVILLLLLSAALTVKMLHKIEKKRTLLVAPPPLPAPLPMQAVTDTERTPGAFYLGMDKVFRILPHSPDDIILLGNSLTCNFPAAELFGNLKIKNRGISGDHVKGLLLRIKDITSGTPRKIFIEIGINDIFAKMPADTIVKYYGMLLDSIRKQSPHTTLYVQSIFPIRNHIIAGGPRIQHLAAKVKEVNLLLQARCMARNVTYLDIYSALEQDGELKQEYTYEGVHLNGAGYLKWKELISNYLR